MNKEEKEKLDEFDKRFASYMAFYIDSIKRETFPAMDKANFIYRRPVEGVSSEPWVYNFKGWKDWEWLEDTTKS
jgi:hypothetical protein